MTAVLLLLVVLYLWNRRIIRILLCCLLPAFIILPAVFRVERTEGWAFCSGAILICLSPVLEWGLDRLKAGKAWKKAEAFLEGRRERRRRSGDTAGVCREDEFLNQKGKWRLLLTGYVIFMLFIIFATVSIVRLNGKINSLHEYSRSQQELITEQQNTIRSLTEEIREIKENQP